MAKPYGFLDAEEPATEHYMLSGYARPQVARVRVLFEGGDEIGRYRYRSDVTN